MLSKFYSGVIAALYWTLLTSENDGVLDNSWYFVFKVAIWMTMIESMYIISGLLLFAPSLMESYTIPLGLTFMAALILFNYVYFHLNKRTIEREVKSSYLENEEYVGRIVPSKIKLLVGALCLFLLLALYWPLRPGAQ